MQSAVQNLAQEKAEMRNVIQTLTQEIQKKDEQMIKLQQSAADHVQAVERMGREKIEQDRRIEEQQRRAVEHEQDKAVRQQLITTLQLEVACQCATIAELREHKDGLHQQLLSARGELTDVMQRLIPQRSSARQ